MMILLWINPFLTGYTMKDLQQTILTFLQDLEFLPKDLGNLGSQVEYFNIPVGKAHDAKGDVKMTVDVYRAYCKLLAEKKDNISGVSSNNLLSIVER